MPDQGRDPLAYFGRLGFGPAEVLADSVALAASSSECDPPRTGPHVVTGPIRVSGLSCGDVVEVEILDLKPRCGYGLVSNRHGLGALPERFPGPDVPVGAVVTELVTLGDGHGGAGDGTLRMWRQEHPWAAFPFSPCLGIVGVAAAAADPLHSVPPRPSGGNLDLRFLGRGWRIRFLSETDGGNLFVGDPHFAQGDGEVALTAVEGSLTARLRVTSPEVSDAERAVLARGPVAESERWLVAVGLGAGLDAAFSAATSSMIDLLAARCGVPEASILAYLSAAARVGVTQVVNRTQGAHMMIDKSQLRIGPAAP